MAASSERAKRRILTDLEMQFQTGALFDSMKVGENIAFVLDEQTRMPRKKKEDLVTRLLQGVNLLQARDRYPHQLSGGMKKRVAVARTLATSPRLAMFDEPAAGLDPVTTARIVNLIKELVAEGGMTVLAATTDVHLATRFSSRLLLLLRQGRVWADAPWSELKASPDEYTRRFLSRALQA